MPKQIRVDLDLSKGQGGLPPTPAIDGSHNVYTNDKKTVRIDDSYKPQVKTTNDSSGKTSSTKIETIPCKALKGSPNVFVNDKSTHRNGDALNTGDIADHGSSNVFVNDQ